MTYLGPDRRKPVLMCGPGHKIIPTLGMLCNCLKGIEGICFSMDLDMDCNNYGGKVTKLRENKKHLQILVANSIMEVDKLIRKDIEQVNKTGGCYG